jgi:hypothetical protein
MNPGHPEPSEYAAFFEGYVQKARSVTDPIASLTAQMDEILALLAGMDAGKRDFRYAPGKWTVKELVNHITDAERVFGYRAMCVARNDPASLPGFEENGYSLAAEAQLAEWDSLVQEFEFVRKSSISLFRNLPEAGWTRVGTANNSPISVRAMAMVMYGHVAHHLEILHERYL